MPVFCILSRVQRREVLFEVVLRRNMTVVCSFMVLHRGFTGGQ